MSSVVLGFVLDILVLIFLGAMIFYAMRLSSSLNAFRKHREDFDQIITNLVSSINQAEKAIQNLKVTSDKETGEMRQLIKESKGLSEELKIINEASESMAKRLEGLAERNRKIVQGLDIHETSSEEMVGAPTPKAQRRKAPEKSKAAPRQNASLLRAERPAPAYVKEKGARVADEDVPSFIIQDRDYPEMDELGEKLGHSASNDYPQGRRAPSGETQGKNVQEPLQSQAERDLYEALQKTNRKRGGGA